MGMYVVLTAFLFQKGSSESKPIDEPSPQDEDPRDSRTDPERPGRSAAAGGSSSCTRTRCRSCSSLLFAALVRRCTRSAVRRPTARSKRCTAAQPVTRLGSTSATSQFWFESMQNWQSEFLAIAVMVGASVFLRQRGSAESKPVAAPHHATGT